MMVKIDVGKCIGCGACVATCPTCFEMKDGKASIKGVCKEPCVKDALEGCPVNAISM
jgi:ferredoxin